MDRILLETIVNLRIIIGYLGETEQFGWWQSSFFVPGSQAFLAPVFPRTYLLAQFNGITQAAALVHDEFIGVGNVYHLFRLPEEAEQDLQRRLLSPEASRENAHLTASRSKALTALRQLAAASHLAGVGPIRVGEIADLHKPESWRKAAGYYLQGFETDGRVFPYFSDIKK